jgi:hypothetical protein
MKEELSRKVYLDGIWIGPHIINKEPSKPMETLPILLVSDVLPAPNSLICALVHKTPGFLDNLYEWELKFVDASPKTFVKCHKIIQYIQLPGVNIS